MSESLKTLCPRCGQPRPGVPRQCPACGHIEPPEANPYAPPSAPVVQEAGSPAASSGTAAVFLANDGRARAAVVALALVTASNALTALASLLLYKVAGGFGDADRALLREMSLYAGFVGLSVLLGLVLTALCAVLFVRWFRRAYENLLALGEPVLAHAPIWAVAGFFVPILHLFRPYQIAKEIWHGSDPELDTTGPLGNIAERGQTPVTLWWGFWIGSNILSNVATRAGTGGDGFDALRNAQIVTMISEVLAIVAGILAIRMIRRVTSWQNTKHAALEGR